MNRLTTSKTLEGAKKKAKGSVFLRVDGVYVIPKTATGRSFKAQKLVVLYSPTGRIIKSLDMPAEVPRRAASKEARIELLRRLLLKGTTRAEVLKRTGWKSVSMQEAAKHAGLELIQEGSNPIRYRGRRR